MDILYRGLARTSTLPRWKGSPLHQTGIYGFHVIDQVGHDETKYDNDIWRVMLGFLGIIYLVHVCTFDLRNLIEIPEKHWGILWLNNSTEINPSRLSHFSFGRVQWHSSTFTRGRSELIQKLKKKRLKTPDLNRYTLLHIDSLRFIFKTVLYLTKTAYSCFRFVFELC